MGKKRAWQRSPLDRTETLAHRASGILHDKGLTSEFDGSLWDFTREAVCLRFKSKNFWVSTLLSNIFDKASEAERATQLRTLTRMHDAVYSLHNRQVGDIEMDIIRQYKEALSQGRYQEAGSELEIISNLYTKTAKHKATLQLLAKAGQEVSEKIMAEDMNSDKAHKAQAFLEQIKEDGLYTNPPKRPVLRVSRSRVSGEDASPT